MHVDYKDTFKYFKTLNPKIDKGTVLDYGSNSGTFLVSAGPKYPNEWYTGIDTDASSIEEGKKTFPLAEFIHYNAFNHMYNAQGVKDLPLPITKKFDTIISYSVFTHTTEEELLTRIEELYNCLNPEGQILFTYLDPFKDIVFNFFTNKRISMFGRCDSIQTTTKAYLVDADVKPQPEIDKMLATFYNTDYLLNILSKYNVRAETAPPNCHNCFQDCIVITK